MAKHYYFNIMKTAKPTKAKKENPRVTYPFSLKDIRDEGVKIHNQRREAFMKDHPPQYRDGPRSRYSEIKDIVKKAIELYALAGHDAKSLGIYPAYSLRNGVPINFRGTLKECEQIKDELMRQWWSLPRDREIKTLVDRMFPKYRA